MKMCGAVTIELYI